MIGLKVEENGPHICPWPCVMRGSAARLKRMAPGERFSHVLWPAIRGHEIRGVRGLFVAAAASLALNALAIGHLAAAEPRNSAAPQQPASAALPPERALLNRYCV